MHTRRARYPLHAHKVSALSVTRTQGEHAICYTHTRRTRYLLHTHKANTLFVSRTQGEYAICYTHTRRTRYSLHAYNANTLFITRTSEVAYSILLLKASKLSFHNKSLHVPRLKLIIYNSSFDIHFLEIFK